MIIELSILIPNYLCRISLLYIQIRWLFVKVAQFGQRALVIRNELGDL